MKLLILRTISGLSIMMILGMIILSSCTKEPRNLDLFYGEWDVVERRWTIVDGTAGPISKQEYILEFNESNCGKRYNINYDETNEIKWVYQDGEPGNVEEERYILISTLQGESNGSFNFGKDRLYGVALLSEDEIGLRDRLTEISNDTLFHTVWNLELTKR